MLSLTPAAGRPHPRLTASPKRNRWFAAAMLCLTGTAYGAAQGYQNPGYSQQPYPAQSGQAQATQPYGDSQQDPPSRVARLSAAQGAVSVQPASVQEFSAAEVNYPLTSGDRLWTDSGSMAELQIGQVAVRAGQQTDFTVTGLTDTLAQFGLAQGSVHLRTFGLDPNTTTELDTPNAAVTVLAPGDVRVDVYPANGMTAVTLLSGEAQVDAPGLSQQLRPGESLQIYGDEQVTARDVRRPRPDGLDGFSFGQDSAYESALASESAYVSSDTIGAADLSTYGDWSSDPDYGAVWYPRGLAVDWQPYRNGHWTWVAPWGWTWIEAESWGFAPFHYGRWGQFHGRWGWIPGPAPVRPIYSPALVAFVGGVGVTAWFPLGPREPYQPWYHSSDRYLTRVNVSNIYNRNFNEVRNIYAGRGPSPFHADPNRQYANRGFGTVAVPQGAFAEGKPVQNVALRGDLRRWSEAPVLPHPPVSPTHEMVAPRPARAVPPQLARPELRTHTGGFQRPMGGDFRNGVQGGNSPGGQGGNGLRPGSPGSAPGQGQAGQPDRGQNGSGSYGPVGPQRGRPDEATSPQAPGYSGAGPARGLPGQQPGQPQGPIQRQPGQPGQAVNPVQRQPGQQLPAPVQTAPTAPVQRPFNNPPAVQTQPNPGFHAPVGPARGAQPETMAPQPPARTQQPAQPTAPAAQPTAPAAQPGQPPQGAPFQRPLFNRSEPPQPRPSFDQQRQTMERTDPGRPLAPQQMNNLQQNRAAGPPPQRESVPHPAPQPQAPPRPAPQPQAPPQPSRPAAPPPAPAQPKGDRVPK